jgi:hypothetical protein
MISTNEVLVSAPWYKVTTVINALVRIRNTNFSIHEQRLESLAVLNDMRVSNPFRFISDDGKDRYIFVGKGLYLCEFVGKWPRLFQVLRNCLSFKDFSNKERSGEAKEKLAYVDSLQRFSDASVAFLNVTNSMIESIQKAEDLIDRRLWISEFASNDTLKYYGDDGIISSPEGSDDLDFADLSISKPPPQKKLKKRLRPTKEEEEEQRAQDEENIELLKKEERLSKEKEEKSKSSPELPTVPKESGI